MLNIGELSQNIEEVEFLFLVVLAIVEIGIDLLFAHKRNYQDTVANIAIAIIYSITSTTMIYGVVITGLAFFSQFSLTKIPINGWTLMLAVIIADFIYYWEHRTEHWIRFFWAYHNVHHSSTDYNLTVASRLSWAETCFLWIFYIPMALLGFDPLLILIAVQIGAAYQTWIHTQKIGGLGILERIINTPALHRVHHASNPNYIDKNFGGILMIWDRLFGTYQAEEEVPVYGLTENIKTNNPIQINVLEYQRIARYISKSRSAREIWFSVFGTLDWQPKKSEYL
jgi:sterol desaturase/sphingolipid hydroxylase (fatty acid hydroxylase superfamily)